jgi:hypothetical protein
MPRKMFVMKKRPDAPAKSEATITHSQFCREAEGEASRETPAGQTGLPAWPIEMAETIWKTLRAPETLSFPELASPEKLHEV